MIYGMNVNGYVVRFPLPATDRNQNTGERKSNMTALLINGLSVLMLLFFGAMALYPFLLPDRAGTHTEHTNEDRVLHISPAPMIERRTLAPTATAHQPIALGDLTSGTPSPSRREAA
jgi:hypothetical protein